MNNNDDAVLVGKLLQALPSAAVSPALEARILADFDRLAFARSNGWMAHFAVRWGELLWPGAPLWQPVSLLALSLVVGLTAGAFVPSATASDQSFAVADTSSVMDLYKDL